MSITLLIIAVILIACVIFRRISDKLGIPMLLAFILLGMFFGSDGVVKIPFDNYALAEQICSVALIFIMFYGGFGTKWSSAKPVAAKALLLSSFGTVITAALVGVFCHAVLRVDWLESVLIGSVIASTDAASVFSILRSRRLNLKDNTASLLEVESGSNDPFSYMLTVMLLTLMNGGGSFGDFLLLLAKQLLFGTAFGFLIAWLAVTLLPRVRVFRSDFYTVLITAIALVSYAAPTSIGGNGYLSAYITGIVLGNSRIGGKKELVHFFDGVTGMSQIVLFFLLGLLAFPSQLPGIAPMALAIALFLTLVARPLAVTLILAPFRSRFGQIALVSWAGMRGAASIVFAVIAVIHPATVNNDIFHIVFFIVLFSILLQGTLLPLLSRVLHMTDNNADVMKTFTDYMDEVPIQFLRLSLPEGHPWVGNHIKDVLLPPDSLLVLIIRGKQKIVPTGRTAFKAGDVLILSGQSPAHGEELALYEKSVESDSAWCDQTIAESVADKERIVLIRRGNAVLIPRGNTRLREHDVLVMAETENDT